MTDLRRGACAMLIMAVAAVPSRAAEDLAALEQQAMQAAVARVAPSVVRIETVGGLERSGEVLFGTGPTTGLIVGAEGWIVSSAFNFAQQPTSILVSLPDGSRLPARLVATDHNRMLVLLKVEPAASLPTPEPAPLAEAKVGAWAVAVGRTYQGAEANLSVGIVSALGRMHGRAIQTDAKVSPANYGGPLIDIQGRVLGILVPLSPQGGDEVAGVEWYDSGIGFAIPYEKVTELLPRLQAGEDLRPGIVGVTLAEPGPLAGPVIIQACRPNSPAAKAGLAAGDKIVEVDGAPIVRTADLYRQVMPHYAGETLAVAYERDGTRHETQLELVAALAPYAHPYLGILPGRAPVEKPAGVVVRHVLPDSPAAKAGVVAGDVIVQLADAETPTAARLLETLSTHEVEQTVSVAVQRGGETLTLDVTLAAQPETLFADVPAATAAPVDAAIERPPVGRRTLKLPEFATEAEVYIPDGFPPDWPLGMVFWYHGADTIAFDELLAVWRPWCDSHGLVLVAPRQTTAGRWTNFDLDFAQAALNDLRQKYEIDRERTVAAGLQGGATIAHALAFKHRDQFGGVVAIDGARAAKVPDNEPARRLAILAIVPEKSEARAKIDKGLAALRKLRYPVIEIAQPGPAHLPADDELRPLVGWIDTLDRI